MSHFINGQWSSHGGDPFHSTNPATQQPHWTGTQASFKDIEQAISAANTSQKTWRSIPIEKRIEYLRAFEKQLTDHKSILSEAISQEVGKPLWESNQEVERMIDKINISIEAYQERCANHTQFVAGATLSTYHRPHGVMAVLGPFNFPGHIPNGHIIPALLAGNTVVFKGSEQTPMVSEIMGTCWEKALLPPGVFNLLQGEAHTAHTLITHPGIHGVLFTGSYSTGTHILESLGAHPEKIVALEMGGNNPLLFTHSSNLPAAVLLTLQSAFLTAGQRCNCARRLIVVEREQSSEFITQLLEATSSLKIGPYTEEPTPFMGPLINLQSQEHLLQAQAALISQGGALLKEMRPLKEGLLFVTPGIIDMTDVENREDIELFGPLLQLIRVPTLAKAIEEANQTQYGLSASLISESEAEFQQFFTQSRAGVVNWNRPTTGASSRAPFGGTGKSGNYRPSGYFAADYCSHPVASIKIPHLEIEGLHLPGMPHGATL